MNASMDATNAETDTSLPWDGERFLPGMRGRIAAEHLLRYAWARAFVGGKHVLDVASGEGYGAACLSVDAASVVGIDNSEAAIRHAGHRYDDRHNLTFKIGDICHLPFADKTFDVVVSLETLEHVADPHRAIRELRRVLKDDGLLVASTPNREVYSKKYRYSNKFHLHEMTLSEFTATLSAEFAQLKIFGQISTVLSLIMDFTNINNAEYDFSHFGPNIEWPRFGEEDRASNPPIQYYVAVCGPSSLDISSSAAGRFDVSDDSAIENEMSVIEGKADASRQQLRLDDEVRRRDEAEHNLLILQQKHTELEKRAADFETEIRRIPDLEKHAADLDAEIRRLSDYESEANTLRETLKNLLHEHRSAELAWQAETEHRSVLINQLYTSTTWRATGPFRAIASRLKRLVKTKS